MDKLRSTDRTPIRSVTLNDDSNDYPASRVRIRPGDMGGKTTEKLEKTTEKLEQGITILVEQNTITVVLISSSNASLSLFHSYSIFSVICIYRTLDLSPSAG